jgi:isoquinoline 1-oxidoreductase beta subunit
MLIAEELEVDLRRVKVVAAPVDSAYAHPVFGMQMTGGSTSIASEWERYRKAGAAAREMLLGAAAEAWTVDRASLRAENGTVIGPGGQRLTYGQLVERAATRRRPRTRNSRIRPSGSHREGDEAPDSRKVTGEATFGLDATVPAADAVSARPPVFGGTVKVNADRARAVRGVKAVQRSVGVAGSRHLSGLPSAGGCPQIVWEGQGSVWTDRP